MVTLIALLVGQSLFAEHSYVAKVIDVTFILVFVTTLFAVWRNAWMIMIAIALGLPMFGLRILITLYDFDILTAVSYVFGALFFIFMFGSILYHIVNTSRVTMNTIYGAVSAYLLIGLSWAFLFGFIEYLYPGALVFPDTLAHQPLSIQQYFNLMAYFSFTNLTTLGFGDINPVLPIARTLSYLEAVIGQLYLTILVARLVSLHIAHQK
jgi:hypothetical protein